MRCRSPLAKRVTKATGIFMLSLESRKPWSSDTTPTTYKVPWNFEPHNPWCICRAWLKSAWLGAWWAGCREHCTL